MLEPSQRLAEDRMDGWTPMAMSNIQQEKRAAEETPNHGKTNKKPAGPREGLY